MFYWACLFFGLGEWTCALIFQTLLIGKFDIGRKEKEPKNVLELFLQFSHLCPQFFKLGENPHRKSLIREGGSRRDMPTWLNPTLQS